MVTGCRNYGSTADRNGDGWFPRRKTTCGSAGRSAPWAPPLSWPRPARGRHWCSRRPRSGQDEIRIGVTGTVTLASNLPAITDGVAIVVPGSGSVTIDGVDSIRTLVVDGVTTGTVSISGLTVTGAVSNGVYVGNTTVPVTITDVVATGNETTGIGGGVSNVGLTPGVRRRRSALQGRQSSGTEWKRQIRHPPSSTRSANDVGATSEIVSPPMT